MKNSSLHLRGAYRSLNKYFLTLFLIISGFASMAQSNLPITGFNDDLVADGIGASNTATSGTMPGVTYPAVGVDGVGYTFIDATYKWHPGTASFPTCFLPTGGVIPSAQTSGLSYQLQSYSGLNSMSIASNTYTGSVLPTTGSVSLTTPDSYSKLFVLYETVQNTTGTTITATITFSDASTQVISGISFVNWFTATSVAYTPTISRAQNAAPGAPGSCTAGTGPFLFEMPLNISPANYGKLVSSVSFNFSSAVGAASNTVNYLHVLALGGITPCATPIDQPSALNLTSPTGTTIAGSFTAAPSAPSAYLTVSYLSGVTTTDPVAGANYAVGNSIGAGKVVAVGASTSFNVAGLLPGITYDIYTYAYNEGSCAKAYNTISPAFATITTSNVGATTLINPFGDGGFENGTTFGANGWTDVNGSATNKWFVGTAATPSSGVRSAFVDNGTGITNTYTNTSSSTVHFYRDVTFPAGQTAINLSFKWKGAGEASYDFITVYAMPTTNTPTVNSPAGAFQSWLNFPTAYPGAVIYCSPPNLNLQTSFQTQNICLPASFAGTTQRLVFTWINDGTAGTATPAGSVDEIALVSSTPLAPIDQATALNLTAISTSQIDGSFTAAASVPTGYVVVRYPNGATPTNPATGTTYVVGNSLGSGTVVSAGTAITFSSVGLAGGTSYDFYVYSYISVACAGLSYNTASPLMATLATNACGTLSGTIPVGPTAPASPAGFPTINNAYAYISANGLGGNTILELQPDYTTTYSAANEGGPIVFTFSGCVNASKTLTIQPEASVASVINISTASTNATVQFNGATYITIDGRPGGTGASKMIAITNTSSASTAAGNAVVFRNDAQNNTITYVDLMASNLNPATNTGSTTIGAIPGVVAFHSTTGIAGNDNNTISYCNIHPAGSTGNLLAVGIYAYNATTVGSLANNDNNTITNNLIYDVFHASAADAAIDILAGNNNYIISNNSVFQTANRTYITTAATHRGFWITPGASTVASSGHTVSGNFIGGTSPNCGGTPYTMLGTIATIWLGMDISVGTLSATNVANNTIQNIALTTTSTGNPYFAAITVASGNVVVGSVAGTGNTVGAITGNGSITLNNSTTSSSTSVAYGIRFGGGTVASANYNTIGSITINNAAISNSFVGLSTNGGGTASTIFTNNLIGSTSTSNSIQTTGAGTAATAMGMCGIFVATGPASSTVSNNVVANMNTTYAGTSTTTALGMRGIDVAVGNNTVANNVIRNLSSSSIIAGAGSNSAIVGLSMRSTTASSTVSGNQIYALRLNTTSATTGTQITGIYWGPATTGTNVLSRNFIHSFDVAYTTTSSTAATFTGVDAGTGTSTIQNNMIRLGINEGGNSITTPLVMRGISIGSTSTVNVYHNSIHIGGTGVTNASSVANHATAFNRSATTGTLVLRNNIFSNTRENATAGQLNKHFAVRLGTATTGCDFDFNDYYTSGGNDNSFALNNTTAVNPYSAAWITGDLNSVTGNPMFIDPSGNASTLDLHIDPSIATVVEQGGTFVASVVDDFDGQTRSSFTPVDLGADAGIFTPLNPCAGPPPASTATLTNTSPICGSGTKTIYLAGFVNQPGFTYQWQESSTGGGGTYINVSTGVGATATAYTTATLTSPMYYQCIVKCTNTGDSTISSSVLAPVNANPIITVSPVTGTNVCSGSNVDLEASGALTYTWACNPGVGGYPSVSLFSTPNNTAKVTSRPSSTLSSSTAAPPATVATPTWVYTVTGTDAAGCSATASVTLSVITAASIPLQLNYSYSPDPICEVGIPVTFTVTNGGNIGSGQWEYNWYDQTGTTLLQTVTTLAATDTYTPATATTNGNKVYSLRVSNTACPSSYVAASPSYFVGYTALIVPVDANCGDNGSIAVYPEGQTDFSDWYINSFATGLQGPAFDATYGSTNFTGGRCNITPQSNSQTGTFLVRNPASINTNNLQVNFNLSTAPLGFAFNILGADGMAWSYAPDVYQGVLTPGAGGFNSESGSGTGFKLAFDATANGATNTPGVYLMYNCTTPDQGPAAPGVLAFKQGSFWQGLVNAPVSILISENGFVTVSINNTVIFDHIALPAAYLTANKSNWLHAFTARTGGSNELHAIDDLSIRYNTYEYSNNSTTGNDGSWQGSNKFIGLAAGTYPMWVRKASDPSCFAFTGNGVVGTSPSPTAANTVVATDNLEVVCYGNSTILTTDISVPGASFIWESAPTASGPWTAAVGANNDATYTTAGLVENTYFRTTFTCPAGSPVISTPKLITVNAGSILSTNSPQTINCLNDVATLTAVPGANTTCVWYNSPTGGSPLANGNTYTVTPTSLPTTYYVEPVTTVYSNHYYNGGQTVISNAFGSASSGTGIATRFTTTASVIIDSIFVLPSAAGTLVVAIHNAASATVIASVNFTVTSAMVGSFVKVPVNLIVPGSGNYQIVTTGVACSYYSSYTAGSYTANYMTLGGGIFVITAGATTATGASSTSVYGTAFRISISSSCPAGAGARIPVLVEANPTYFVSATPATSTICLGATQTLNASSANAYSFYGWTPITDLYEDAAATIPYTGVTSAPTVYAKPSTSGAKTYTVSTLGSGCTNSASLTLNVTALPTVSASATPTFVCQSGNVQLNATVNGAYCVSPYITGTGLNDYITNVTLEAINNTTGASATPFNTYYSSLNANLTATNTYTVSGTLNNGGTENVAVWIDYNQNGTFEAIEKLGEQQTLAFSIAFTVPPTALNGTTRMRVKNVFATTNIGACTSYTYGEVEDYNVTISGGTTPVGYTYDWSANSTYLSATNIANPVATALSTAQTYTVQVVDNTTSCSNTGTVSVAVNMPSSSTTSQTTCGSYTWNGNTYTVSGTYTFTALNSVGCDSVASLVLVITPCNTELNLKCFIECYMVGPSLMLPVLANSGIGTSTTDCDTLEVNLHSAIAPHCKVYSTKAILQVDGNVLCTFSPLVDPGSYYIAINHRSSIETWSANPVSFLANTPTSYDFSTAITQAFGDNEVINIISPGVATIYSGDIVKDCNIDLLDLGEVETDASMFIFGYDTSDMNGDGNVDLLDPPCVEINSALFIFCAKPAGFDPFLCP